MDNPTEPGGNGHQMDMFGQSSFVEAEDRFKQVMNCLTRRF